MEKFIDYLHKDKNNYFPVFLMSIACIALNLILSFLVGLINVPIWMDTVGTVLAAVIGGYLPGIFVGFFTNLCRGITDFSSIYYGVLNVLIAVAATFMFEKGWLKKVYTTVLFIIVLTLIGGGLGGILPWLLSGFPTSGYFTDLAFDCLDKTITVLLVLLIIKFLPESLKSRLYFYGWRQTPLSDEDIQKVKKIKCRSIFLRSRIILILSVALVILAAAATTISFVLYRNSIIDEYAKNALSVANLAKEYIDPEKIDEYIKLGDFADGYKETEERLEMIRESSREIEYLYVYRIEPIGCRVVFDLDTPELEGANPGALIVFDDSFKKYLPKLFAGEEIDPIVTNDTYGWLLTAYTPLKNAEGECVAYVGTDIAMSILAESQLSFFTQMVFLFLGFVILIVAVVVWFVDYCIVYPIDSITLRTAAFLYNTDEDLSDNVEKIRKLAINTGDEVENLYYAFLKMTEDTMEHVEELDKKTRTISEMQNALIMVLADMVENRDKNTGQHIKKTAAYVEIILKKMREMGLHEDLLSDRYIENVVKSAPLHDIGKIRVSDNILCKPGKLTDEEYEKMKQHTTAGYEVISRVIEQVPDSGYLNEAKELAHYHHEKWNGKGYPDGISGEKIPLSARVMAVADVFDALVSKRVYKDAFPFEKAVDMIRQDAGTAFDPAVVEAFESALDEVRAVASDANDKRD